jgi:hypothetical protein
MNKKFFVLLFMTIFSVSAFAMQGRGGGGGARGGGAAGGGLGAPAGGPSTPSSPGSQGNRPANSGKPDSATAAAAQHKSDAASHAVDPKDTHGFKNYGEYVAANHVSENLGIPLADLKASMDAEGGNLGKAIHSLRPALSPKEIEAETKKAAAAAKKAEAEAKKKS